MARAGFPRFWLFWLVFGLAGVGAFNEAEACRRCSSTQRDRAVRLLGRAQRSFDAGAYHRVKYLLEGSRVPIRSVRLERRRMELVAVANIRTGHVTLGVTALRRLLEDRPDDPYLLTRLAEGLAQYRATRQKQRARRILERLDADGWIVDDEGRAVLAHLRQPNAVP